MKSRNFTSIMIGLMALLFLSMAGMARAQGTSYYGPTTLIDITKFGFGGGSNYTAYPHATSLWIPNDVAVIRGVIILPNGVDGDARGIVTNTFWQTLARMYGFALMGTRGYVCYDGNFAGTVSVDTEVPVLLSDFAWYATESGRPEVANLPMIITGWSACGQVAYGINTKIPERMITFIANKGGNYIQPPLVAAALKTPCFLVAGELDGQEAIRNNFQIHRPKGAIWAVAFEEDAWHKEGNVNGVWYTFLDHAIRARLPAGTPPLTGPVTLLDLPETSGWLAAEPTGSSGLSGKVHPYADYPGTKTSACWLMDADVANLYRGFATWGPAITVTVVGGPTFAAGQTIQFNVSVDSALFPDWVSADVYDGAVKLGTVTNGGATSVSAVRPWGARGVTAIARDAAGNERTSIPQPFVVSNAVALANTAATEAQRTSANLNATFCPAWGNYTVTAYWGTDNGGSNATAWQNSKEVGTWTGGDATNVSYTATGLSEQTDYYFTFRAKSTVTGSTVWATNVMSFSTVTPNAPTSSGAALTALEDTATALAAGNFGYTDPLSVALAAVQITSLPALGTLNYNGTAVGAGGLPLTVTASNIGNLSYQSALNGNGTSYTTMGIKVMNANNLWSVAATMTLNVTPVNDAPTSTGGSVNLNGNPLRTFSAGDFPFADVDAGDTLGAIQVTSLPALGTLKLNDTAITVPGAVIPLVNIGTLTYTASPGYTVSDSFTFKVRDAALFSADATMTITGSSTFAVLTAGNPTHSTTDYLTNTTELITNTVTAAALNSLSIDTTAGSNIWDITNGKTATITTGGLIMTGANDFTIKNGTLKSASTSSILVNQNGAGTLTLDSVIANGSGNSPLTKAGTGTLILSRANTYTGATTISDGILYLTNATALQNSALDTTNSVAGSDTAGLKTNATTLTLGGLTGNKDLASVFTTALGGTAGTTALGGYSGVTALTLNTGPGVTNTYAGSISDGTVGMALTKTGAGTQTLSGAHTLTYATINGGTIDMITGGSLSLANGFVQVGSAVPGILKIDGGSLSISGTGNNTGGLVAGGSAGNLGAIYLNSGSILCGTGFNLHIGGVGYAAPTYGFLNITGGTISGTQQRTRIGQYGGTGLWYQSGGIFTNVGSSSIDVGYAGTGGTNIGVVYLSGSAQFTSSTAINVASANVGIATLTVAGSAAVVVNAGLTVGAASGTTATINLNGGTLTANNSAIANNATGTFNFNGGTLKAGLAGTLFSGTGAAYVYPGGATIDTQNNAVTISQALQAPAGNGVTTIPVTSAGSGYIGAPYVALTGDGAGATAVANMVDDGTGNGTYKVGSITVTAPGRGYTQITAATLSGGLPTGGTAAVLNFASATFAANAGGGLTKVGIGTLTLSNNNTYSGTTTVSEGTLAVTNTTGSGSVTVKPVATLAGTGTISGNVTIESGGFVAPGVSGIGTLTLASATLSGTYQCNLDATTCDVLAVGALTVNGTTRITFSGTPAANQYIIATYATMIGSLPAITPPSGYHLDTATFGVIQLVKDLPPGDAPSSTNATLTALEDTQTALAAGNFGYSDPSSDPLAAVRITSLPALGTLKWNGTVVVSGDLPLTVVAANIGNLTYQSALNGNGPSYTTFGIAVQDTTALWSAAALMTVNVTAVNDAPVATAQSVTTAEDTALPVTLAGTDAEGSALTYAIVTTPAHGALSGTAPNVTYTPTANYNGADSFTFKVNDGTVDSAVATVTITVTAVNDAPTSMGGSVTMPKNTDKTFAATDFTFSDVDSGDTLGAIRVTSLPAHGTLSLGGTPITSVPSATIAVANIGTLTYTPTADYIGAVSFNFQVRDASLFSADATMAIAVTNTTFIPVQDPSFETPGASLGGPWAKANAVWNPNLDYAQTNDNSRFATRTDAGIWYANLTDPGDTFYQNLATTVNSGDTLAVTFYVGRELGQVGGVMAATFKVGTTSYTQNFDTTGLTAGTWQSYTLTQTIANTGNLILQFSRVSGRPWLDNISNVSRTPYIANPVITATGSPLSALSTTYGTASAATSFTVAGANMTAGILVTAPTGLEVSQVSGSGYGSTTTVGSSGTIGSTTVYVRLAATAPVGTYNSQNIVLSSTGATAVNVTTAASGNSVSAPSPVITLADTLGAVNTTYGTASATPTSFHVAASNLTPASGNLTVTPPTGYEVSLSSNSGYSSSLSVSYSSSTLASTRVYARLAATTAVNGGAGYAGNISVAGGGASSQTIATASSTVGKATPTVVVTPYTVTYDGNPHSATVTSITGVNGETAATVGTVTLTTTHTTAGTYATDSWSLTGTANYNNVASTTLTNTINKATPTATLTVNNSPVTYDGTAKSATVIITTSSVPGEVQSVLTGGTATQTAAGTYAVTANFVPTDTTNYNTLSGLDVGNFLIGGTTIPVINGSFETEYGSNADKTTNWVKHNVWSLENTLIGSVPITGAFSSSTDSGSKFTRFTYNDAGAEQNLNTTVSAGDTLSVTFNLGVRLNPGGGWGTLDGSRVKGTAYFKVGSSTYSMPYDLTGRTTGVWHPFTFTTTITNSGALSIGFKNLGVNNGYYTSLDNVSNIIVTPAVVPGSYASWAATNGAGSQTMDQDHDHDGVPNGIEHFLGGNVQTTGYTALPGVNKAADGKLSVTWTKSADFAGAYGTGYVIQTSDTLTGTWDDVPATGGDVTVSGNDVIYTFPSSGPARKFVRLTVMGAP